MYTDPTYTCLMLICREPRVPESAHFCKRLEDPSPLTTRSTLPSYSPSITTSPNYITIYHLISNITKDIRHKVLAFASYHHYDSVASEHVITSALASVITVLLNDEKRLDRTVTKSLNSTAATSTFETESTTSL